MIHCPGGGGGGKEGVGEHRNWRGLRGQVSPQKKSWRSGGGRREEGVWTSVGEEFPGGTKRTGDRQRILKCYVDY